MTVVRRYSFKLYPNMAQTEDLERMAALCAGLWNAALEQRETQWAQQVQRHPARDKSLPKKTPQPGTRQGLSRFDQARELKHIRAEDPEYRAMHSGTLELVIKGLDDAFKAFFRRASQGAGASSGYPRYRSVKKYRTIPYRDGAFKFARHGKHWRLRAKGLTGALKARGRFPVEDVELRDMRMFERDGAWWCSIVVKMAARRRPGKIPVDVDIDPLDANSFAAVKNRANGECLPGFEGEFTSPDEQITDRNQADASSSGADASDSAGDGRLAFASTTTPGADARESAGDGRRLLPEQGPATGADVPDSDGDGRYYGQAPLRGGVDAPESAGDGKDDSELAAIDIRHRRGSWRWRTKRAALFRRRTKAVRARKEAAHRWTTRLIREASSVHVTIPKIKDHTRSGRGNERYPGAAVKPVAEVNRSALSRAPAELAAMLEYKATEAGIDFHRHEPETTSLEVGGALVRSTKAVRRASRKVRKAQKELA